MLIDAIRRAVQSGEIPDGLEDWFAAAPDTSLFRINLTELALSLDVPLQVLLAFFLDAVRRGIFELSWDLHCPRCHAVSDSHHALKDVGVDSFCPLCDERFDSTLDKDVEVTFSPHPSAYKIPDTVVLAYRQRMFEAVSSGRGYPMPRHFLSGLACLNNPVFNELFPGEVLSRDVSLQVSHLTFLFADIRDATRFCGELGDRPSYRLVRDYARILSGRVIAHRGLVIKTNGDILMASFMAPVDAFRAALEAREDFRTAEWEGIGNIKVRMGIHTGPVLAVNLDGRPDYFGNAVNAAVRIHHLCREDGVCFSLDTFENPGVRAFLDGWLKSGSGKLYHFQTALKGISESSAIYRVGD
jgi:class 3 adenylate cyclase